jgi:hypothetical protein
LSLPVFAPLLLRLKQLFPPHTARWAAADFAVGPDDAVAGNHEHCRVEGAGAGHRSRRQGLTDHARDISIAARLAAGDLPHGVPDAELKRTAAEVERKIQVSHRPRQILSQLVHPPRQAAIVAEYDGVRELATKEFECVVLRVRQVDGADAPVRRGEEQPAEIALGDGVPDVIGLRSVPRRRLLTWAPTP